MNTVGMGDKYEATVTSNTGNNAGITIAGRYDVKCHDKDGNLKWEDSIDNIVVNTGLTLLLNGALANSGGGTVYMGLKGSYNVVAGTTIGAMVPDATGELTSYTGNRPSPTFSVASSGATSISPTAAQVFAITGTMTVYGCFLVAGSGATSTKTPGTGSTGGVLFSGGNFSASKLVNNLDSLSVTYTASATSA